MKNIKVLWLPTDLWWRRYWCMVLAGVLIIALACSLALPIPKTSKPITITETKIVKVYEENGENASLRKQVASLESQLAEMKATPSETQDLPDPADPDIVGEITHQELIEILREIFPTALFRGASSLQYDLVEIEEIEKFLAKDNTDKLGMDRDSSIHHLIGQCAIPGWNGVPVGFVRTETRLYNLVVVSPGILYGIDPQTDEVWKIKSPVEGKSLFVIF